MGFWDRWGPIGLLETTVHGDGNFAKDIKAIGSRGLTAYNSGLALSDDEVGQLRGLRAGYADRLARGNILAPNVVKSLAALRGRVADNAARNTTDLTAGLAQRNAQSGGRLSPEAIEELRRQGESSIRDEEFETIKDIGVREAELELTETNRLNDRIEAATAALLNNAQFRTQLGQQAQVAAILARLDRNKAIAGTISSFFGGFGR